MSGFKSPLVCLAEAVNSVQSSSFFHGLDDATGQLLLQTLRALEAATKREIAHWEDHLERFKESP